MDKDRLYSSMRMALLEMFLLLDAHRDEAVCWAFAQSHPCLLPTVLFAALQEQHPTELYEMVKGQPWETFVHLLVLPPALLGLPCWPLWILGDSSWE